MRLLLPLVLLSGCTPLQETPPSEKMMVCLTAYWRDEGANGDKWTKKGLSSTGHKLECGKSAAVDPKVIPYFSKIELPNGAAFTAVDTGSAVKARTASRKRGKPNVPVLDLYFETEKKAKTFLSNNPPFMEVAVKPGPLGRGGITEVNVAQFPFL